MFNIFFDLKVIKYLIAFSVDSICSGLESPLPNGPSISCPRALTNSLSESLASLGPDFAKIPIP